LSAPLTANGKIILLGEHAVLDGAPALALPLPGAMRAHLHGSAAGGPSLSPMPDDPRIREALALLARLLPGPGFELAWEAVLPPGAGLGASASLSFLLVRAAWQVAHPGLEADPGELAALTHRLEHCFHGTPSGIDDAVVCLGTPVLLQRPAVKVRWPFPGIELAPHLWQVTLPAPLHLVLAHSGEAASTREMIARVRAGAGAGAGFADDLRAAFDAAVDALEAGDDEALGRVLTRVHARLARAGASTLRLDRLVDLALQAGAFGAKLTGSGGGGCALALCPQTRLESVAETWRSAGFNVLIRS